MKNQRAQPGNVEATQSFWERNIVYNVVDVYFGHITIAANWKKKLVGNWFCIKYVADFEEGKSLQFVIYINLSKIYYH